MFMAMAGIKMQHVAVSRRRARDHRYARWPGAGNLRHMPSIIQHIRAGSLARDGVTTT